MGFSSILFVYYFLPVFLLLYFLIPGRLAKDIVLLVGSLFFYAWGEPVYVILLIFSAVFNYFMGLEVGRTEGRSRKHNLIFAVAINLLILCFFKYYGFLLDTIGGIFGISISHPDLALPIGISFYTFRSLSYLFDINSGKVEPEKNFLSFGLYSTMFPYMSAGPIVRYAEIREQLKVRSVNVARLGLGAEQFIKGLSKKVILADNLAIIYNQICQTNGRISVMTAWLGIFAYTMQIYFDFSGYSDMAIGLAKMLGFDFPKNFDYPYTSETVSEFWRRWHISLGSWFRDYVYIPLGGNRAGTARHIRNILIVWALTGLWHGASWNFVLWGVYYGLLLLLEKYVLGRVLDAAPVLIRRLYTILLVMIGWVLFSQTTFGGIAHYLGSMFGVSASGFADTPFLYYLRTGIILFVISVLACQPNLQIRFRRLMLTRRKTAIAIDVILLVISTAYLVYNTYSPFLYQQF